MGNWWDYPPSPVVGVSPSASPQYGVTFHEDWLPHVMGLLEKLHDDDYFTGTDGELETNYRHVVELLARVQMVYQTAYPNFVTIPIYHFESQGVGSVWQYVQNASQWLAGLFYPTIHVQDMWWKLFIPLAAGTYSYRLWGQKSNNLGKSKIRFNGVWQEASLFDWYSAAAVYNVRTPVLTIEIVESGLQEIAMIVPAKNPASSDYYLLLNALVLNANI